MTPSKAPVPFSGTWRLTKCEASRPDLPHPIAGITTFTQEGDALRYTNEGTWSDGRIASVRALIQTDGTWSPVAGSLLADSLRLMQDGRAFEAQMRKNGIEVGTTRNTVSMDGRTMTGEWEIIGPGGSAITWRTTSQRE